MRSSLERYGCIYSNKDKNFKANHNIRAFFSIWVSLYL